MSSTANHVFSIAPEGTRTRGKEIADAARWAIRNGLSVFPLNAQKHGDTSIIPLWRCADGSVRHSWAQYRNRLMGAAELAAIEQRGTYGLGMIMGKGDVECLDIDNNPAPGYEHTAADVLYQKLYEQLETIRPALCSRLAVERTRSGGYHLLYRYILSYGAARSRSRKLAMRPGVPGHPPDMIAASEMKAAYPSPKKTLIEIKGAGGLSAVYPTPHYTQIQGDTLNPQYISYDDVLALYSACIALSELPILPLRSYLSQERSRADALAEGKPGWAYNQRATVDEVVSILERHQYTIERNGPIIMMTRPGKRNGTSGTVGACGNAYYNFSTNDPSFDGETAYSPFAVRAILDHGGNFAACASMLSKEGYGDPPINPTIKRALDRARSLRQEV